MTPAQRKDDPVSEAGSQQADEAAFDHFATDYREVHSANLGLSGEEPTYFAEYKVREVARCLGGAKVRRILDFGCGIGGSMPFFQKYFSHSRLLGVDISKESLRQAELIYRHYAEFRHLTEGDFPVEDESCDLAFAACVFHHIPPDRHRVSLENIRNCMTLNGHFFLFEHNPLNPLTVHAVNTCPFDADAILIRGKEMVHRVQAAGFKNVRLRYCTFFPRALSVLRPLEPHLAWLPLGAQYYVQARP